MSLVQWASSFNHYTTPAQRFNTVIANGGASSVTITSGGRNSNNCLKITSDVNITGGNSASATATLPVGITTINMAFGFLAERLPGSGTTFQLCGFSDFGSSQGNIIIRSDGIISYRRGTAVLGSVTGFSAIPNIFYHFEVAVGISNGTGGFVQLWVNEVLGLNLTGVNTQNQVGSQNISEFFCCAIGSANQSVATSFRFNDVIITDGLRIGDSQVLPLFPTGTTSSDQWTAVGSTPTSAAVDETTPNDNTDYASSSTIGDTSIWTFPNISSNSTILAVQPIPRVEKTDSGTAKFKSLWHDSGGNWLGAEKSPSNGSYAFFPDIWMVNPNTGLTWTATDWNTSGNGVGIQRTA